ncbi:unnamed protein product [Rhizoctonia solani]|uniref:Uncharacterized protein n=1 Tax=Rhizoctonia solani TaxID=456999 RepID=A0A8H3H5K8_9AGAM|nr:unnamed protein product [Rhizoctonia solani]
MTTSESTTDFFTCNSEHEKCQETHPRCQNSGIEPPGYTDGEPRNLLNEKIRTLPAPHAEAGSSRATVRQEFSSVDTGELLGVGETIQRSSGPVRPLGALYSLGQLLDVVPYAQPTSDPSAVLVANQLPPYTERQDSDMTSDDEDPSSVISSSLIRRQPVLDKTAESNALPFVLQGYARWISRVAFDPLKLTGITREFVYSQFEDDQSRWTVALLANIGSRVGTVEFVEGKQAPMLSALKTATRQRLRAVKSRPNPRRAELVKAFNCAAEAMIVHFYASPISEVITLRQETASVFRQLCPGPLDAPINLPSLLQHPLGGLWHYVEMDVMFSVASDMPTLFRYDVNIPGSQPSNSYLSIPSIQTEGVLQWRRGIPNQLVLLLANMKMIRQDGLSPNKEMITSLERDIHELQRFDGSSSERYLAIMRSVVQECWRQAAFIYLYMAVCGDSPDTPRVRETFKRYMGLLNMTEPGRFPDELLIFSFLLVSLAAQKQRDRKIIRQRALGLHTRDRTHIATSWIIFVIDDIWTRAHAEQRLVKWSDVAVSRKRLLNV